ncbi:LrgB family protein [Clostridium cellulovorans]|uniref:LrgB family protein n=1 Tax=Clostridium cellulovorans (strain ATCC 35296 / DSM 3052 / OCM 3 / 743B) TaxID=573061 RepID=D9SSV6_CLOC7|nr:LrgB family protein [Clostridium cellulovorans]ADL52618.1 LrgB family protein [Clostridium cellulovorans 743B]
MENIFNNYMFGIILSFIAYEIGIYIYKKTKVPIFNGLLIAVIIVIAVLVIFNIDYEAFNQGGKFINFFITPATVALALPLYRKLDVLKKNIVPIIIGIVVGSLTSVISVLLLTYLVGTDTAIIASLVPKSVTTPIAMEISKELGGVSGITVVVVVITGVIGAVIAPTVLKLAKIDDELAQGIAIGTSAHAVGTSKAVELGETQGAMSGLAIGIAGIVTVIIAPICLKIAEVILK